MRIFRKCDTDGGGEIDLTEFKMAMFAVDPVSGNPLGFSPSTLLGPRDAFELFDEDGTGQIDELEFADVLEYFGMDVSDEKQEKIFKKYDRDKSGYIDYREFRSMWVSLVDVREELTKRGVEVPKHTRQWKLQQMLEALLDEEEAREAIALEEAAKFLQRQRDKEFREQLGRKAIVRAEDELAAALDAAGQVYIMGSGKYDQFAGDPVIRDEALFPGFKAVSEIWSYRVSPDNSQIQAAKPKIIQREGKQRTKAPSGQPPDTAKLSPKPPSVLPSVFQAGNPLGASASKYVRRRLENKRWKFRSPPRLNKRTIAQTKTHIRVMSRERDALNEPAEDDRRGNSNGPSETSDVEELSYDQSNQNEEELAKMFFENREFVRSLRFRSTTLMTNTGPLWGRSVVQGAISDSVAFAVTGAGSVFSWGGKNTSWEASARKLAGFDSDSDEELEETNVRKTKDESDIGMQSKITPRSALLKMCTTAQRVVMYYDVWEPPPSNATRVLFMEQVLLPKVDYEQLIASSQLRGLQFDHITKMELALALGECFEMEVELKGEEGHSALKMLERQILKFDFSHDIVHVLLQGLSLRQIACSYSHSAAVDSDGALYTWGATTNGKLGIGIVEDEYKQYSVTPLLVKFPGKRRIRFVSCGVAHSGAVSTEGELFMWGSANGGRLGLGSHVIDTIVVPTLVRDFVKKQIRVWQVSCGTAHSAVCTVVTSEFNGGSKKLLGGQVYVCGGATALSRYVLSWERVPELDGIGIRQVTCGGSHTAAVSSYGELYTWGRNYHGCTGHDPSRTFVDKPELLKCFHVEPYNLALGKPCRQITIYNEQGPHLAVNGEIDGTLATCIHTHVSYDRNQQHASYTRNHTHHIFVTL
ncbi:unnamed protein product [Phytophthora lilii]|uniref:Unnamed protein product n=1 Tax=Phytophthora lilii TaxID=2077276 RepID=A0A9W6THB7_9STRA|nr:unnamed protein product [Phytophthora lilii]